MTLHRDSLIFSKKGQREWNEEFQIIFDKKMIDMSDQSDNFYKDKYTDVVYNDFRDSAIEVIKTYNLGGQTYQRKATTSN